MIHAKYYEEVKKQEELLNKKNKIDINGIKVWYIF